MNTRIVQLVHDANPTRSLTNITRRKIKLVEEIGEVAEAYLNVTSPQNGKGKTWDDVREELADCLIVALDIALTPRPIEEIAPWLEEVLEWRIADYPLILENTTESKFEKVFASVCENAGSLMTETLPVFSDFSVLSDTIDLCLLTYPDRDLTHEESIAALEALVERKIAKWLANRANAATDGTDG